MHSFANNQESNFFKTQPGFFPTGNSSPGVSASPGAPPGYYYSPLADPQLESGRNFSPIALYPPHPSPTYNYFQSNPTLVQHYYPGSNSQTNTTDSFNVVNNVNSEKTNQEPDVLRKGRPTRVLRKEKANAQETNVKETIATVNKFREPGQDLANSSASPVRRVPVLSTVTRT